MAYRIAGIDVHKKSWRWLWPILNWEAKISSSAAGMEATRSSYEH
jgi:hypothetical protein